MRVLLVAAALAGAGCWTSSAAPGGAGTVGGPGGSGAGSAVASGSGSGSAASGAAAERPGYIEPISCSDVGVILRGSVDKSGGGADSEDAGPAKERAIAQACIQDGWPRAVIECVGHGKSDCLDGLSSSQQRSYDARMERWRVRYLGGHGDRDGEEADDQP